MAEKLESSTNSPSAQDAVLSTYIKPQAREPHDPDITFEEYHYYALRTREEEKILEPPKLNWREVVLRKKNVNQIENQGPSVQTFTEEKFVNRTNRLEISDEEWTNASRAFRTASWGACE
jgi:hypothetical protein